MTTPLTPDDEALVEGLAQYLWRQTTDKDVQFGGWDVQARFFRILARGSAALVRAHDAPRIAALEAEVARLRLELGSQIAAKNEALRIERVKDADLADQVSAIWEDAPLDEAGDEVAHRIIEHVRATDRAALAEKEGRGNG